MRGNPLWQLALVVITFVVMALPVWRLTRPARVVAADVAPMTDPVSETESVTLETTAEFVPTPTEFSVTCLGQPVLQGSGQGNASTAWKTSFPTEGIDLVLHVVWTPTGDGNSGRPSAVARIIVRLPDGREIEKSFWAKTGGALDAVFTVPGNGGVAP